MRKPSVSILKVILFSMAFAMASIVPAIAQQEFSIQSENMQGTREIVVHLPKNYDPDRSEGYPVIYMLDAGSNDAMTAEMAGYYHWGDIMPEVIVIGLKNVGRGPDFLPHYYEFENNAGEQVVGNGGKLLAYIESELIPFVDNQLNTSSDKVFAGHSWGGQFITYALSQSPGLFNAYFITSPSFGNNERWSKETFDRLKETLGQDKDFPEFIYLSAGEEEERPARLADYHRLTALLKQYLPEGVRLYHEVHNGANHTSNGAISMGKALQLYFAAKSVGE